MIKLENIVKRFNLGTVDETVLFDNFDFTVKKGEFVSVVGSNGSGKTTMLNIICGTTGIDSGKVLFKDKDITNLPQFKRSRYIGRVFQSPQMGSCNDLTILENIALADNKNRSFSLTPAVNTRRIDYYRSMLENVSMGLENRMNVNAGNLSGGQRQALALLLSTMTDIDLLILDEHTAALDPKSSETIMELTNKICLEKGITTIMVTHNLRHAVQYGNRLVMMHQGKTVVDVAEDEKKIISIDSLLSKFNQISIECGN